MSESTKTWLDEIGEAIDELLADVKRVKFNTHKNRKLFAGELKALIKDAIHKNTIPIPTQMIRHSTPTITRPKPDDHKPVGFAVMTEGLSQAGDDLAGRGPNSVKDESVNKIRDHKTTVRHW